MSTNPTIEPMTLCMLMAAGLAGLLFLHFQLLTQVQKLRRQVQNDHSAWRLETTQLRAQITRAPEAPAVAPAPVPVAARLNVNKRSQALRMSRCGDPPERIAAALSMPKKEVDLLLKVHRAVSGAA